MYIRQKQYNHVRLYHYQPRPLFLSLQFPLPFLPPFPTTGQQSSGTYRAHRYNLHIHTLVFISFQLTKLKQIGSTKSFFPFIRTALSFKGVIGSQKESSAASRLRVKADSSVNTYTRVSAVTPSGAK